MLSDTEDASRSHVQAAIAGIVPWDLHEARDRQHALHWISSGAAIYRRAKPDVPPKHLVAYFVVVDPDDGRILLVEHRGAGLLLPTGGHATIGETLWQTVDRECMEELAVPAAAVPQFGQLPLFVTVTATRDPHGLGRSHIDVSVWHIVAARRGEVHIGAHDEFTGLRWLTPQEVLKHPLDGLDPAMHRFTTKYLDRVG